MLSVTNSAPVTTRCESCGKEISPGADSCQSCGRTGKSYSSKFTLAIVVVLIVAGFALTQYVVRLHRTSESSLATRWFHRGEEAMLVSLPVLAANDYRTALSYDPENNHYRLRLAEALLAAGRLNEARAHLLSLWEDE